MASMELSNFTQAQTLVSRPTTACISSQLALSVLQRSAPDPPFLSAPHATAMPDDAQTCGALSLHTQAVTACATAHFGLMSPCTSLRGAWQCRWCRPSATCNAMSTFGRQQ